MNAKRLQFLIIYFAIIAIICSSWLFVSFEKTNELRTSRIKLEGVEYLRTLYDLNLAIVKYMYLNVDTMDKVDLKMSILSDIGVLYNLQEKNPAFKNELFNAKLERLKTFKCSEDEYYELIDLINQENYVIGDKSKLLFESDRELYFLSTLATHYLPEYLTSFLEIHGIAESMKLEKTIIEKNKNIFIEQNKLVFLSAMEIGSIVKLLSDYEDTKNLLENIVEIKERLLNLVDVFQDKKNNIQEYIESSHVILALSLSLNEENFKIIEIMLENKKETLQRTMDKYKTMFFGAVILVTFLMFFYYMGYISNMKKDIEIKSMHAILDQYVVFYKTDVNGVIAYASGALEKLAGYSQSELIGNTPRIFKNSKMDESVYKKLWDTILDRKIFSGEMLNKAKDCSPYWIYETILPEVDKSGNLVGFSVYMLDVTDKKELSIANEKLQKLSTYDSLTQIYNRLKLDNVIEASFESYKRYKKDFSIILIDIDYFKDVNDRYGHLVGDEVLKKMSRLIEENIRATDCFGRWGGEEFMIVCEQTNANEAYNLAEKIRNIIAEHTFDVVGAKTLSLGVAQMRDSLSMHELLIDADDALYEAKESGRNKTIVHIW